MFTTASRLVGLTLALAVPLALAAAGCAADSSDAAFEGGDFADASMSSDSGDAASPGEQPEIELVSLRPSALARYVFVVAPSLDSVARVDSETLAVTPIRVGRDPRLVLTTTSGDRAVSLNRGSHTVSIIDDPAGDFSVREVDVLVGSNAVAMSPDGKSVVVWYDNAAADAGDVIGSLQDVTVVSLEDATAQNVSVGFSIRGVRFREDGQQAYVVAGEGVTTLNLRAVGSDVAGDVVLLTDTPSFSASENEVAITGDGAFAVLRVPGEARLRVVALSGAGAGDVPLPGVPTDVDLLPDGRTAVVALRSEGTLGVVDLRRALAAPETALTALDWAGDSPGSVTLSAAGDVAAVYSNSAGQRTISTLSFENPSDVRTVVVAETPLAVVATADAGRWLALHAEPLAADGTQPLSAHAFSAVDMSEGYAKYVALPGAPDDIITTPDAEYAAVRVDADGVRNVTWVDLTTFRVESRTLQGAPEAIGVVPATGLLYVSERSSSGRLTFISPDTGEMRHISGFELNALIE